MDKCLICETEIKKHDGSYCCAANNGKAHSDCMIRGFEFSGEYRQAEEIQVLDEYYSKKIQKKRD